MIGGGIAAAGGLLGMIRGMRSDAKYQPPQNMRKFTDIARQMQAAQKGVSSQFGFDQIAESYRRAGQFSGRSGSAMREAETTYQNQTDNLLMGAFRNSQDTAFRAQAFMDQQQQAWDTERSARRNSFYNQLFSMGGNMLGMGAMSMMNKPGDIKTSAPSAQDVRNTMFDFNQNNPVDLSGIGRGGIQGLNNPVGGNPFMARPAGTTNMFGPNNYWQNEILNSGRPSFIGTT